LQIDAKAEQKAELPIKISGLLFDLLFFESVDGLLCTLLFELFLPIMRPTLLSVIFPWYYGSFPGCYGPVLASALGVTSLNNSVFSFNSVFLLYCHAAAQRSRKVFHF